MIDASAKLYAVAAGASAIGYLLHAFGGGALLARRFYAKAAAAGVPTAAFRYCWHFVSIALLAMSGGFLALVGFPDQWMLGVLLTAMAAFFSVLAVATSMIEKTNPLMAPPTIIFAIVAAAGAAALAAG